MTTPVYPTIPYDALRRPPEMLPPSPPMTTPAIPARHPYPRRPPPSLPCPTTPYDALRRPPYPPMTTPAYPTIPYSPCLPPPMTAPAYPTIPYYTCLPHYTPPHPTTPTYSRSPPLLSPLHTQHIIRPIGPIRPITLIRPRSSGELGLIGPIGLIRYSTKAYQRPLGRIWADTAGIG